MSGKEKYTSMLGSLKSGVVSISKAAVGQAVGAIIAGAGLIAFTAEEQKQEKERRAKENEEIKKRQAARMGIDLDKMHQGYSACMATIKQFQLEYQKECAEKFIKDMESAETRNERILQINSCRSLTKDFWRQFAKYRESYGEYISPADLAEYKAKYERFRNLVQPLDHLEGYTITEKAVYNVFPSSDDRI